MHHGHHHANNAPSPQTNGTNGAAAFTTPAIPYQSPGSLPQRTTSTFTTSSAPQDSTSDRVSTRPVPAGDSGWGGYTGTSTDSFRDSGLGSGGGFAGGDQPGGSTPPEIGRTNSSAPRPVAPGVEETVTVTSISEKEGMMFFQHRNYEVTSARRNSRVIRRYSDFVWLLDCLHKRYPFRQLPLLPPKRVASKSYFSFQYWKTSRD